MSRIATAGLTALAVIAFSNDHTSAGSVHVGFSKAEVQAARVQLYEHEMHVRAKDPTAFDHKYHLLGKILGSEQGYNQFLKEHTFSKLLCVHTPFLWRVVEGDILYHKLHPFGPGPRVPDSLPDVHQGGPPSDGGSLSDHQGPGGPDGQVHSNASVPEPSSCALMASGLGFVLLAVARRRIYRLATAELR